MKLLFLTLALLQPPDREAAILQLSGAATMEELSESELERYETLSRNPVKMNLAPRSKLLSCGLFTPFQVASFLEYTGRTGDVLSFTELATIFGFGEEFVQALKYFVSLESHSPPGSPHRNDVRQDAMARAAFREDASAYAGKYHAEIGEKAELYLSGRSTWSEPEFALRAASLAVYGKQGWKAILGDFNSRYGQGQLLWDGFVLSGYSTLEAMRRNGSGISPTGSFSPGRRGFAMGWSGGRWCAEAGIGGGASVGASYCGSTFNLGCTFLSDEGGNALSLDWKKDFGHLEFYGEGAGRRTGDGNTFKGVAGLMWSPAYRTAFALLARGSGSRKDERGLVLGGKMAWCSLTADASFKPAKNTEQYKSVLNVTPSWEWGKFRVSTALRWTERCKISPSGKDWRHEPRADAEVGRSAWSAHFRADAVQTGNSRPGWLGYLDAGLKTPSDTARIQYSVFARISTYKTPDWASRIYSYERELPGGFSVPAYYGTGRALTLLASLQFRGRRIRHRLGVRASLLRSDKKNSSEIKIQYNIFAEK